MLVRQHREPQHDSAKGEPHADDGEFRQDADARGRHLRAHERPREGADAPGRVESRHDRAGSRTFDRESVGVHADIHRSLQDAEQEQARKEAREIRTRADERLHCAAADEGQGGHDVGAELAAERATDGHCQHCADSGAEQGKAEPGLVEMRLGLNCRDSRGPDTETEAVEQEGRGNGDAPNAQLGAI